MFIFPLGYRLNKFCGEHLVVVNESPEAEPEYAVAEQKQRYVPNENYVEHIPNGLREENGIDSNGPVAEALIQNEQMFHSLKILKPSPSEMENQRRKSIADVEKYEKPRKGVYSQVRIDFCLLFPFSRFIAKKSEEKKTQSYWLKMS